MIPDHLIDQAAAAIYAATVFGDKFAIDAWRDMPEDAHIKTGTREFATAALEAVAADIWEQGAEHGALAPGYDPDDNPFKVRTRELATAALEAVAAEIWQEGVNFALPGKETWAEAAHNPYKRNEHA